MDFAERPLHFFLLFPGSLAAIFGTKRLRELGSGELAHRRRELGGGGARGGHGLPWGVLARRRAAGGVLPTGAVHGGGRRRRVVALR